MFGFRRASCLDCLDYDRAHTLPLRAAKFDALSVLFGLELSRYVEAIDALLEVCPGVPACPARSTIALEAGRDALAWTRNVGNVGPIHAEHIRLFGGENPTDPMPCVAPCASMYLTDDPLVMGDTLLRSYEAAGFIPTHEDACPSHIVNELKFIACLLRRAADGDLTASDEAEQFISGHLFTWGAVFSAATYARSDHPVTSFAGLMLENLLFCELEHGQRGMRNHVPIVPQDTSGQPFDGDVQ